jgi:hypothetical protein
VTSDDLLVARRFLAALEAAVRTGDHGSVLELLSADVEWTTPQRTLRGIDEVRTWRVGGSSGESFKYELRSVG